ncbi:TIGR00255 family protein [Lachnospiraceae bacterium]|nr:TIGR00255 family protein [Lachnospiraceae bacterium]
MIKSMTGFGRAETEGEGRRYSVEIKTVNHRYLEVNIKMPKVLAPFEGSIRTLLKEYMERGKVDIFISFESVDSNTSAVRYNSVVAHEYFRYLQQMADEFGLENDVRISGLSRYPDVFTAEAVEIDEDTIWKELQKCIRKACEQVVRTRKAEGENLSRDLIAKLDEMKEQVAFVEQRSPEVVEEYRRKLREKVEALLGDAQVDEARLIQEVTIFADRICVDEEIVRLKSHIDSMRKAITNGGTIGRRLDFIAQEMNREANTTLSKANDLAVSDAAIDLKTGIEKVREQIQNIE